MHLRYVNKLGIPKDIELTNEPLSIGRAREADIPLLDDKVSRIHCGIRLSDGEFYLKDLKSRNGTYGICQACDNPIERPRLKALPFARKCLACQNAAERGRTKYRPFEGATPLRMTADDTAGADQSD